MQVPSHVPSIAVRVQMAGFLVSPVLVGPAARGPLVPDQVLSTACTRSTCGDFLVKPKADSLKKHEFRQPAFKELAALRKEYKAALAARAALALAALTQTPPSRLLLSQTRQ